MANQELTLEKEKEEKKKTPEELIKELEDKLEEKERKIKELEDKLIRVVAEMEHLKRRFKKEKEEYQKYCHEEIVKAIIPAIDNLERAISHASSKENFEAIKEGVEITLKLLLKSLEEFGVKQIPAKGKKFDPFYHEAMSTVETDEYEPGTVVEEFRKGYMLGDRLLRPSLVSVAKKPEEKEKQEEVGRDGKEEQ